ncbi:6036_t:CDS:2 [Diversispora eburnea]|uniref:6036_t:CDS:1 n=1 Tax=Diversispora eburnea TaxID=1213867 RepID=A0A9N9AWB4_9GLOM|nr:6036_t:CDS:2 [Diversispora eburnea]
MANKITTEILVIILNKVQSLQDFYSSLLVNQFWCKVTILIFWELTLGRECSTKDKKLRKNVLCIRTYISCMDRCTFLDCFELTEVSKKFTKMFHYYSSSIGSILKFLGAARVFQKLESLTLIIRIGYEKICPLYESLTLSRSFFEAISQKETLKILCLKYVYLSDFQEFIKKILKRANTNLRNVCLDLYPTIPFETFLVILNNRTKITELSLNKLT